MPSSHIKPSTNLVIREDKSPKSKLTNEQILAVLCVDVLILNSALVCVILRLVVSLLGTFTMLGWYNSALFVGN